MVFKKKEYNERLLDILMFIYMAQWCNGVPKDAVKSYWKDIKTLFQLDLIERGYDIYCTKKVVRLALS
jgi:hypothetical protein